MLPGVGASKPFEARALVDIVQHVIQDHGAKRRPDRPQRVCEGLRRRPPHTFHDVSHPAAVREAGKPVAAILGRAEDQIVGPECRECRSQMAALQLGNVTSDNQRRAGLPRSGPAHARPEVSRTLREGGHPVDSFHCEPGSVRGYRQQRAPRRIRRSPAHQPRQRRAIEAECLNVPDIGCKPGFDGSKNRLPREDHDRSRRASMKQTPTLDVSGGAPTARSGGSPRHRVKAWLLHTNRWTEYWSVRLQGLFIRSDPWPRYRAPAASWVPA